MPPKLVRTAMVRRRRWEWFLVRCCYCCCCRSRTQQWEICRVQKSLLLQQQHAPLVRFHSPRASSASLPSFPGAGETAIKYPSLLWRQGV